MFCKRLGSKSPKASRRTTYLATIRKAYNNDSIVFALRKSDISSKTDVTAEERRLVFLRESKDRFIRLSSHFHVPYIDGRMPKVCQNFGDGPMHVLINDKDSHSFHHPDFLFSHEFCGVIQGGEHILSR